MSSSFSELHRPPSYDDADDPLLSKPEKSPKHPKQSSFNSREQFWWNMISLSGRCLTTALSLSFLVLGLLIFSRMGELSSWEQRGFNALTILLSAFASLGLGSVLGYLGSMLRWPLLARKKYNMRDILISEIQIELLLAMPSPSGSLALIYAQIREWRFSSTTFIVMLYLFINIVGRFSVAIFGLTYNLADLPIVTPPTHVTDWSSSVLVTKNAEAFDVSSNQFRDYLDLVEGGLATLTRRLNINYNSTAPENLGENTVFALGLTTSTVVQDGNGVKLKYEISDFNGSTPVPSNHTVESSVSCTMFRIKTSGEYWKDYSNENSNQTSGNWKSEANGDRIAEVLRVLDKQDVWPGERSEWVTWAAPLGQSDRPSVTYVVYSTVAWECTSILVEKLGDAPHPTPLFNSSSLFPLPIANKMEAGKTYSTSVTTSTQKAVFLYPSTTTRTSVYKSTPVGRGKAIITSTAVRTVCTTSTRTTYRTWTISKEPTRAGRTASVVYRWLGELQSRVSPSFGVQKLDFYKNGEGGSPAQKQLYNLYVATLVARLPITAIAYANTIYPRKLKNPDASPTRRIKTTLEVEWLRVGISAGVIVAGQMLGIAAVLYYCRNVYIREESFLATAVLLKTVLNKIDDASMMTTVELEDALNKALKGPISYGTVSDVHGECPQVALDRNVNNNFPKYLLANSRVRRR
ncbi:hypothetical protein L873DRAFT_1791339 [Choiromyces venosus 120613-1]|uniref:Uncharacterized protein n=1 Tax=Choiromyces venosus 120613-1 TaxID=1336337 RepID=A0A3N4JF54_9PEZI|nr:hypothetical protein L873DRAFT_1791339 [Choiromyces venosus 120613-1]